MLVSNEEETPDEFENHPSEADRELAELEAVTWGDRLLGPGALSPRHLKLAEYAAQGKRQKEIAELTGYTQSRVSILLSNTRIRAEVLRIQERIYEDTIGGRLKKMSDPALAIVEKILTDRTNRVKISEQADMAKWVLEKLDGKATQKFDVGENMLGLLMDKLDHMKNAGKGLNSIDVTPLKELNSTSSTPSEDPSPAPLDPLKDWIDTL